MAMADEPIVEEPAITDSEPAKEHSKSFKKYSERYARGGCTKEQVHRLTELGVLYDWEYKEITGEDYTTE